MNTEIKKDLTSNWFKMIQESICNSISDLEDNNISFIEAMLNGLAKDGGLYVPKGIKKLTKTQLSEISKLNYENLAF